MFLLGDDLVSISNSRCHFRSTPECDRLDDSTIVDDLAKNVGLNESVEHLLKSCLIPKPFVVNSNE